MSDFGKLGYALTMNNAMLALDEPRPPVFDSRVLDAFSFFFSNLQYDLPSGDVI